MLQDNKFNVTLPISKELLELWEDDDCGFTEYFQRELLKALQEYFDLENKRIENEILNGTGDKEPTGIIHVNRP